MKIINKIMVIIFTITITICFSTKVSATSDAPNKFTVESSDSWVYDLSDYFSGWPYDGYYHFHYKQTSDGKVIYCIEIHDSYGTDTYTLSKEESTQYAYVLENGYPNKNITGDNKTDYLITSFAVFYLTDSSDYIFDDFDLNSGTYKGTENNIVKEMAKLVNGAKNYTYTSPSIKINDNNNFTLSEDKEYYISSEIGVTTTGTVGNYTVTLENAPSGTIVTDINGNEKNNFKPEEKFIIKVPVSSITNLSNEFNISVSCAGSIAKAYSYIAGNSNHQNTIALYTDSNDINDKITLNLNITSKIQISKIDAVNSKELPGATLTLKDANDNEIEKWVSTEEVHVIEGLTPGTYKIIEEIAPEGYELIENIFEFTLGEDGKVYNNNSELENNLIILENEPEPKQVPTGNSVIYITISTGIIALGIATYFIFKNKNYFSIN